MTPSFRIRPQFLAAGIAIAFVAAVGCDADRADSANRPSTAAGNAPATRPAVQSPSTNAPVETPVGTPSVGGDAARAVEDVQKDLKPPVLIKPNGPSGP